METISAHGLTRSYRQRVNSKSKPASGWMGNVRRLWSYDWTEMIAVDDLSFTVREGERVAFVGPNGAGKSTTIKMLAGILTPSRGHCLVAGFDPCKQRMKVAHSIGTVFGQRSQLWYHLPVLESCYLLGAIYDLRRSEVRSRLDQLGKLFNVEPLLARTAKQLSLGERMRCELVASILHRPRVLFLDEPTIGLDVVGKETLRALVRQMSNSEGCTVLLTSHDTGDMEHVCERVIVINHGKLIVDAPVSSIRNSFLAEKQITVRIENDIPDFCIPHTKVERSGPNELRVTLDTRATSIQNVMHQLIGKVALVDLKVEDASMEEVIKTIYRGIQGGTGK